MIRIGKRPSDHADDESVELAPAETDVESDAPRRAISWSRVAVYGLLPALALVLAMACGFLKWQAATAPGSSAEYESLQAAKDSTVALLSYTPQTVESDLAAAREMTTGNFRDSYSQLTHDVVIPGSKEKLIAAVASVPAASSVSADPSHAVVLVLVNQKITMGADTPADSASSVRVTLDKVDGKWLVSGFDPV